MAHFAELNSANVVLRVIVVDNNDILDNNNVEQESLGQALLTSRYGGNWKQTSYNGNFRGNYAGIDTSYYPDQDLFMPIKQYESWVMNTADATWQAPSAMPSDGNRYSWDEDNLTWVDVGNSGT